MGGMSPALSVSCPGSQCAAPHSAAGYRMGREPSPMPHRHFSHAPHRDGGALPTSPARATSSGPGFLAPACGVLGDPSLPGTDTSRRFQAWYRPPAPTPASSPLSEQPGPGWGVPARMSSASPRAPGIPRYRPERPLQVSPGARYRTAAPRPSGAGGAHQPVLLEQEDAGGLVEGTGGEAAAAAAPGHRVHLGSVRRELPAPRVGAEQLLHGLHVRRQRHGGGAGAATTPAPPRCRH